MKYPIGICTWSLKNNLQDITSVILSTGLKHLHLDIDAADVVIEPVRKMGLSITSTMVAFPQEDYSTMDRIRETGGIVPDACWSRNREIALKAISTTAKLGVDYLSTHAGFIDHADQARYAIFRSRLLELADASASAGISLLLETGQESARELRHCLEDLDHPALGVNFDPANMILYDKGDPVEAVNVLGPWIRHVHIKDANRTTIAGEWGTEMAWGDGQVPHADFLRALDAIGFSGAVAIEREAGEQRIKDIEQAVDLLKKQL